MMKKIVITIILMLNLIPILDREGITLWPAHTAYGQNQGQEDSPNDLILDALNDLFDFEIPITNYYTENGQTVFELEDGTIFSHYLDEVTVVDQMIQTNQEWFANIPQEDIPNEGDFDSLEEFFDWVEEAQPIYYPEENQPNPDCNQQDQAAGLAATNLFNNTAVQSGLQQTGSIVPGFPESGFSIRQSAADGSVYTSDIETGTNNSVDITNYQNSVADVHIHANSNYPPSATDIFSLVKMSFFGDHPNLKTSFVVGNDGTQYAMTVTDESKVIAFYNQINGAVDSVTNNLNPNTALGAQFFDVYNSLINTGNYTPRDAFERSTAAILEGSGITLLKAPPVSPPATNSDFKKIGVESSIDSNGNPIFKESDCP
jgi:hypothetical protein